MNPSIQITELKKQKLNIMHVLVKYSITCLVPVITTTLYFVTIQTWNTKYYCISPRLKFNIEGSDLGSSKIGPES